MAEREDPGKALLRMLHAGQAPAPPSHAPHPSGSSMMLPSAIPTVDVRGATAGRGNYDARPPSAPSNHGYFLPHPRAAVLPTPNTTPSSSAGADLLRMLQQGSGPHPPRAVERARTSSQAQNSQQHQYQQQQQQHYAFPLPSNSTSRSIAAEQERILKTFLSIGDSTINPNSNNLASVSRAPATAAAPATSTLLPDNPRITTPASSLLVSPPSTPPNRRAYTSTAAAAAAATYGSTSGGGRGGKGKNKLGRGKEQGRGRDSGHGGRHGGGGGGGGTTPGGRSESRSKGQGRGGRGQGGAGGGKNSARGESRRGRSGGRGGDRNSTPQQARSYALSAFQNSPDPKYIPIPSLQHYSRNPEVSEEGGGEVIERSSASDWRSGSGAAAGAIADDATAAVESTGANRAGSEVGQGGAGVKQELVMQTPPPPPRPAMNRSSAKKAEDDIKRMLRLG